MIGRNNRLLLVHKLQYLGLLEAPQITANESFIYYVESQIGHINVHPRQMVVDVG